MIGVEVDGGKVFGVVGLGTLGFGKCLKPDQPQCRTTPIRDGSLEYPGV